MNKISQLVSILLFASLACMADDAGVAEVRLFEEEGNQYIVEVDVPPTLAYTISPPMLPPRCSMTGDPEVDEIGSMLVFRFRFTSADMPLRSGDELLLYWQRSGVIFTAYWLDGSSRRIFVDRELTGFRIPVSHLKDFIVTPRMLFRESMTDALRYLREFWMAFALLALAAGFLRSIRKTLRFLLAFSIGLAISMPASDLGIPPWSSGMIPLLVTLATLVILGHLSRKNEAEARLWPIAAILGIMLGLEYKGPVFDPPVNLTVEELITARFYYLFIVSVVFALATVLAYFLLELPGKWEAGKRFKKVALPVAGGLAFTMLLIYLPEENRSGGEGAAPAFSGFPGNPGSMSGPGNPPPVRLEHPIMGYLTLTPFEIRCEWLVRAADFHPPSGRDEEDEAIIPVENQAAFRQMLLEQFTASTRLRVDGRLLQPAKGRADFVRVGRYGVTTRMDAITEKLDEAVVGISLAYPLSEAPSEAVVQLTGIEDPFLPAPLTMTDPWGSESHLLSDGSTAAAWEKRMAGFRRPVIRAVEISSPRWPLVSMVLALLSLILAFALPGRSGTGKTGITILVTTAILLYPFVRFEVPGHPGLRPRSGESASLVLDQLLTNIYRAFDYQSDEAVYDRLSVSATGDQLSEIYLEHRSAMELEERGGARASVDQVEMDEVNNITRNKDVISLDASWVVSGSVSHFGHIHYRKNYYSASVQLKVIGEEWKISSLEVRQKERIL